MRNLLKINPFELTGVQQKEQGKPKTGMAKPFFNILIYEKTKYKQQQLF